jgi:hypothetical protein
VKANGTTVAAAATTENFTGPFAAVTGSGATATINIPAPCQVGLSSARPSATGSGKLYACSDVPIVYVDDPNTSAWQQFSVLDSGPSTAPGAIGGYTSVGLSLLQRGDSFIAIQSTATQCLALKSATLTGSWIVEAGFVPYFFGATSASLLSQVGVAVSNGTTSGTSLFYAIAAQAGLGSSGYVIAEAITVGGTGGWSTAFQGSAVAPHTYNHVRLLSDGTNVYFQYSVDGVYWRSVNAGGAAAPSGYTDYGIVVATGGVSGPAGTFQAAAMVQKLLKTTPAQFAVTGGSGNGTTSTVDVASTAGLAIGMNMSLRGLVATGTAPNGGEFPITGLVANTSISFASADTWAWSSGGTVTATSI